MLEGEGQRSITHPTRQPGGEETKVTIFLHKKEEVSASSSLFFFSSSDVGRMIIFLSSSLA